MTVNVFNSTGTFDGPGRLKHVATAVRSRAVNTSTCILGSCLQHYLF